MIQDQSYKQKIIYKYNPTTQTQDNEVLLQTTVMVRCGSLKNSNTEIEKQVELEVKLLEEEFHRQKTKTVEEELLEQYKYYIQNKHENNY